MHGPWLATLAAAALAVGCGQPVRAELLPLGEVFPERVSPGQRLTLSGAGFPPGRHGRLRLRGTSYGPGREPRVVDVALPARALGPERVEARVTGALLQELGGRSTFRGEIEIAFESAALDGEVVGTLAGAILDFVPEDPSASSGAAAAWLGLGLALSEDASPGALVREVAEGSRAAQAGIAVGDRIVELEGVRVLAPSDVDPPPGLEQVTLLIARDPDPRPFRATIDLRGLDQQVPTEALRLFQLAALVWMLAFLLAGPTAPWIDRLVGAECHGMPWGFALAAAPIALALRLGFEVLPAISVLGAILALTAGRLAVAVLAAKGARARLTAFARGSAGMLAMAAMLSGTTFTLGSSDPALLEQSQGWAPWDWAALRSPAGALGALLVVIAAASGPVASGARVRAIDDVLVAALASCAAIALAGGASAASCFEGTQPALRAAGFLPYLLVSSAIAIVMRRARNRGARIGTVAIALTSLFGSALAVALGIGWSALDVPREVERAVGELLVVLAAVLVVRVATARPPEPYRPLFPML